MHAVDGVSFSVGAGEMVALVGESGCGKTSTAQTVIRMVESDAGSIRFRGTELGGLDARDAAAVPTRDPDHLPGSLRVARPPLHGARHDRGADPRARARGPKAAREAKVREAMERAGLTPPELFIDRYPHELSGGQRQRVAIAAALVLEPKLLIADEPVSMLDVSVRAGILGLLDGLRQDGMGVLMITHDLSTAAHFADRIAVMYLGRIVEEGPARDVVRNPAASVHEGADLGRSASATRISRRRRRSSRARRRTRCTCLRAAVSIRAARSPSDRCREIDPELATSAARWPPARTARPASSAGGLARTATRRPAGAFRPG